MYRPPAFAVDDPLWLHAAIRNYSFATIAMVENGAVRFAYAPVILDAEPGPLGVLRFHVARGNALAAAGGATLAFSFKGPDAYVSPDWYETNGLVPTWNYVAIEAGGTARRVEGVELYRLLVDLSAVAEERLRPKPPWLIGKVPEARLEALMNAIVGFSVPLSTLEGKFKLSQNQKPEDIRGAIAGLEARDTPGARAVAAAMRDVALKGRE